MQSTRSKAYEEENIAIAKHGAIGYPRAVRTHVRWRDSDGDRSSSSKWQSDDDGIAPSSNAGTTQTETKARSRS